MNEWYLQVETCQKLKEIGYNEPCSHVWRKIVDVCDEIREKHPGLSDDGYYELTKKCGGPYRWNQVYKPRIVYDKFHHKSNTAIEAYCKKEKEKFIWVSCPHCYEIQHWFLVNTGFHVTVNICRNNWIYGENIKRTKNPFEHKDYGLWYYWKIEPDENQEETGFKIDDSEYHTDSFIHDEEVFDSYEQCLAVGLTVLIKYFYKYNYIIKPTE